MSKLTSCPVCKHTDIIPVTTYLVPAVEADYIIAVCANCGCMYNNKTIYANEPEKTKYETVTE